MAVMTAAAAMAPAVLGAAAPAAAGEGPGTVLAASDRSAAEGPGPRGGQAHADTAPDLRLEGVPETVEAGGDWAEFSVVIDNAHDGGEVWMLDMALNTDGPQVYGDDLQVQVHVDGVWRDARIDSDPGLGNFDLALLEAFSLPEGRTTVPVRIRAGADAPLVEFFMGPRIYDGQVESDPAYWVASRISALTEGGEKPGEGEKPGGGGKPGDGEKPGGGEKPGDEGKPADQEKPADPETPGGDGTPGSAQKPGDEQVGQDGAGAGGAALAETGGGAAWPAMLGAGGASLAVGAGLAVVARGRRRKAS